MDQSNITLPKVPTLCIAIPTFNRAQLLKELLQDLKLETESLPQRYEGKVEVCVIDNDSTDNTKCLLQEWASVTKNFRVERNAVNLGIEGNIICAALAAANNDYTWLLSDHQKLRPGVLREVFQLLEAFSPTMIVMGLKQWQTSLQLDAAGRRLKNFTNNELGEVAFLTGNLSTNLYQTRLALESMRLAHQISYSAYPNMAKLTRLVSDDLICHITAASSLHVAGPVIRHYDTFSASFINHISVARSILKASSLTRWSVSGFQRGPYTAAMTFELLKVLATKNEKRTEVTALLLRAALKNRNGLLPSKCSVLALSAAVLYLLPLPLRRAGCIAALTWLRPRSVFLAQLRKAA